MTLTLSLTPTLNPIFHYFWTKKWANALLQPEINLLQMTSFEDVISYVLNADSANRLMH